MARRKGKKRKTILFVLEVFVLLLFIGGLWIYGQVTTRLDKIEADEPDTIIQDTGEIVVNEQAEESLTGFTTYALFGIDHRDKNAALGSENSDTMIIACVNNDTKEVRLVSVYRDTLLNIGTDTYAKANAAYAYGGPTQAINMLNTNLDLNIKDYVTVDFNALVTAIDCLGGLDIPLSYAEIVHMNNYCKETAEETGKTYEPIPEPEPKPEDLEAIVDTYHLNGVQAVSYCRIRYTASLDMGRTERQRNVIKLCVEKAKKAGLTTIFEIMDEVFPMVKTSLSKTEILKLIPTLIGYKLENTAGFPVNYKFSNIKGSIIVPTTLESNVGLIHDFLFGEKDYVASDSVKEKSEKINEIVGGESALTDVAPVTSEEDENSAEDSFIWQNGSQTTWQDVVDNVTGGDTGDGDSGGGDPSTDNGGSGDITYDDGGGTDVPADDGGGDWTGGDTGGGDVPADTGGGTDVPADDGGGDWTGGDTGGGDTGGGDTGGGDWSGDTGGGDTGGGDTGGGDWSGDTGGGDDWSGGEVSYDEGGSVSAEVLE
ncbi:MAG: LCP family protein [Blautia sp.]|nr:LCP family protein [Blautia sp.]